MKNTEIRFKKNVTIENLNKIKTLFNRGLRVGEVVVDNSAPTIAKELNLSVHTVNKALAYMYDTEEYRDRIEEINR